MKVWGLLLLLGLPACAKEESFAGCKSVVAPPTGDPARDHANVQTAIASVEPGDVVCLHQGVYRFADELDLSFVAGIEIRGSNGEDGTVWDFTPQVHGSYGLQVTSCDAFKLTNLSILNTRGDAVRVSQSNGITFAYVTVDWTAGPNTNNGAYGLYPVTSSHILVDHCRVGHASDAGIYVGQADTILVQNSEAFGNVAGIEIENSTDAEVVGNWAHDNVGGILVFNLPHLEVRDGKRAKVHGNRIEHNNQPTFAAPASIVHLVPAGTGLMVMAADSNEVHDNYIVGNQSVGLVLISWKVTMMDASDPNYDQYPQSNYIHDNHFENNGYDPPEGSLAAAIKFGARLSRLPDIAWDGYVDPMRTDPKLGNCFENNAGTFLNLDGPDNFNHPTALVPACASRTRLPSVSP